MEIESGNLHGDQFGRRQCSVNLTAVASGGARTSYRCRAVPYLTDRQRRFAALNLQRLQVECAQGWLGELEIIRGRARGRTLPQPSPDAIGKCVLPILGNGENS